MDEDIIRRWNRKVRKNDHVYVLGINDELRRKGLQCESYNDGAMWQDYEPQTFEEIVAQQGREIPFIWGGRP